MPKMKTHKGAKARFKLTAKGRMRREQQMNQHNRGTKTGRHKRRLGHDVDVFPGDASRIKRLLGL